MHAAKRDAATAPDAISRKRAEREVREAQGASRDFTAQTGRPRQSYREQLHFADGKGVQPRPNGVSPSMKNPPPKTPRSGLDIRIPRSTALGTEVRAAR